MNVEKPSKTREYHAKPKYFSISDLFILPSFSEGFGVVNIEAMSCETPVISSQAGGIPEVVRNNETGILLPVEDNPTPLANAIIQLLEDEPRRKQMGKAGRQHVKNKFSPESQVPRYVDLYYRLIE